MLFLSVDQPSWFLFSISQLWPLIPAIVFLAWSIVISLKGNYKVASWLLTFTAFFVALFAAMIDPYLNLWDEQFHALVARNMAANPFEPLLYTALPPTAVHQQWANTTVWLHKQPLFLWQMALSIKLFGPTVLAVRLPSVILFAFIPKMVFDMGSRLVNQRTGWIAALIAAFSYYPLELVSGRFSTDHNDLVFFFYVTASFWAWVRYAEKPMLKWALLVGLFAGAAILVKWLVGLLVFSGWGVWLIASSCRFDRTRWKHILLAFAVSVSVALPWQIYILWAFPVEARYEFAYNARHFSEVIELHGGDWWFHFKALEDLYGSGDAMIGLLFFAFGVVLPLRAKRWLIAAPLTWVVVLYLFFSLAATKMTAFCLPAAAVIWISMAALLDYCIGLFSKVRVTFSISLRMLSSLVLWFYVAFLIMNINEMARYRYQAHYDDDAYFKQRRQLAITLKLLVAEENNTSNTVIFNNYLFGGAMIGYHLGCNAYDFIPTPSMIDSLLLEKKDIWFINHGKPPEIVLRDIRIRMIGSSESK